MTCVGLEPWDRKKRFRGTNKTRFASPQDVPPITHFNFRRAGMAAVRANDRKSEVGRRGSIDHGGRRTTDGRGRWRVGRENRCLWDFTGWRVPAGSKASGGFGQVKNARR